MQPDPAAACLSTGRKAVYALGDHTVNLVLSAATLLYLPFLMTHGGLSPALAGLVIWIARIADAVTDPGMGRLSDATRWRSGRRRPYFLIGALPFIGLFQVDWKRGPASLADLHDAPDETVERAPARRRAHPPAHARLRLPFGYHDFDG